MAGLSSEQIKQLLRTYFIGEWQDANDTFWCLQRDEQVSFDEELEDVQANLQRLQRCLAKRSFGEGIHEDVQALLADAGHQVDRWDENYDTLCDGVMRALIQKKAILAEKLKGDHASAYPHDPLFMGLDDPGLPPISSDKKNVPTLIDKQQTIGKAIEDYLSDLKRRKFSAKGIEDKKRSLGWAVELLSGADRPLKSISTIDARDVRNTIERLPKSFTTNPKYTGLPLRQIITFPGIEVVDTETAIKHFGAFKSFMRWAEDEGLLGAQVSPAATVSIKRPKKKTKQRDPFSHEQLKAIFSSPMYAGCASLTRRRNPGTLLIKDSSYWVPIVGLLSGMRLGEITQLLISDVRKSKDVWCFDVTKGEDDEEEKHLKTESSEREVPIHPMLLRMGFMEFVEEAKRMNPKGRIFYHLKKSASGSFSANYSKWFSRYISELSIKTKKTSFHSFRHSFADACRRARLEDSTRMALMGHADESVSARYGNKLSAAEIFDDIAKLEFDCGLKQLILPTVRERQRLPKN